jgi:hypothetical protein
MSTDVLFLDALESSGCCGCCGLDASSSVVVGPLLPRQQEVLLRLLFWPLQRLCVCVCVCGIDRLGVLGSGVISSGFVQSSKPVE